MQHQKYVLGSQEKFNGGGGTVKITSAPGPTCLNLNWNRLEWLRIDYKWSWTGACHCLCSVMPHINILNIFSTRKIFINIFAIAMLFSHADLVHELNIHNWAGWQDLNI